MKKKKKLEYYVMTINLNTDQLEFHNIFEHPIVEEDIKKALKNKSITTREQFKEVLKHTFMYCFWAKFEYEIFVSPLIQRGEYDAIVDQHGITVERSYHSPKYEYSRKENSTDELPHGKYYLQNKEYDNHQKIDVYEQIKHNLDVITDIVLDYYDKSYD